LCDVSGLARFDTRDANEFFKYDEPDFTNISPKAFLKGIQSDAVYLNEILPSNIHWNCDPELEQMVLELKNKSIQQIAEAQETVIYRLLQVLEKYQSASLLYEKLHFQLVGKYRFKVYGLLGQLWSDGFSRKNWENACPTPANRNYQYLLLGGLNSLQTNGSANGKILPGKNSPLYKSGEVINRIVHSMEYYSRSMGDCYFGLTNNAKRLMESIFPAELKDRQFLVFTLETEAEAEIVKKALLAKGMHFTDSYSKGQLIFCYTRQLR